MLGPDDPLPARPHRILVAGASGSGKTTLAARLGALLALPHTEIDGLFHGPEWTQQPDFAQRVDEFSGGPRWVTEWQYAAVRDLLASRADLLVWLDLPRRTVMRQGVRRTLYRALGRVRLWNGNVEPPLWTIFTDPEHIVTWAWRTHATSRRRVRELAATRPQLVAKESRK